MTKVTHSPVNSNSLSFNLEDHLGIISPVIDSLKIRVDKSLVTVINPVLQDKFAVVSTTTGQIISDENFKRSAYFHEDNGIKTYYRIERQVSKDLVVKEYVTILLSSKVLREKYFDGISLNTVDLVYDNLMNDKVIWCKHNSFMCGECTDVDVKIDYVPKQKSKDIISSLYDNATPQKLAHKAASVYRQKENLGIQYSLRKTKCFKTSPYLKVYEKIRELTYKSNVFKDAFLGGITLPEEVLRVETTIKNKKHFKTLGQASTRLIDILNNLPEVSKMAYKRAFEAHLGAFKLTEISEKIRDLKPMDKVLVLLITDKVLEGNTLREAKNLIIDSTCVDRKQRLRMKNKIERLSKYVDFSTLVSDEKDDSLYYEFVTRFSAN